VLTIGLTGGIGAGKSAVAQRLAALGAVVVDADRLAREAVAAGTDGLAEVVAAFGAEVLGPAGELDRAAVAQRVFADPAARRRLEAIVHPRVRARTAELVASAPAGAIVVNDVPLLVETGLAPSFHLVLVVTAAEATRAARLVGTRGMAQSEAYARIRAQASDAQRAAIADVRLPNDGGLADLHSLVDALWHDRLVPFEANVRAGRTAEPSAAVDDSDRPARFARLAARLRHLAGGIAPSDRIRVTEVAGAPAPAGRLDVLVEVPDPATGVALVPALSTGGFPPTVAGGGGAVGGVWWHGSADPGRPVGLLVRAGGR
jgi:dephospho-CoA kinase